jgi:hypothetical protein
MCFVEPLLRGPLQTSLGYVIGTQNQKTFLLLWARGRGKLPALIPTVIKNDGWYKAYFWRAAAPPAPRAGPNATKDESSFVAFSIREPKFFAPVFFKKMASSL